MRQTNGWHKKFDTPCAADDRTGISSFICKYSRATSVGLRHRPVTQYTASTPDATHVTAQLQQHCTRGTMKTLANADHV